MSTRRIAYVTATWDSLGLLFELPPDAAVQYAELVPDQRLVRIYYESAENDEILEYGTAVAGRARPRRVLITEANRRGVHTDDRGRDR